jgi:multicomponent Na+:H+ antiporter subunit E
MSLPDGFPTVLFIWCVSLMPGTASVSVQERVLTVHVLDASIGAREKLRALERHVSRTFA